MAFTTRQLELDALENGSHMVLSKKTPNRPDHGYRSMNDMRKYMKYLGLHLVGVLTFRISGSSIREDSDRSLPNIETKRKEYLPSLHMHNIILYGALGGDGRPCLCAREGQLENFSQ